MPTKKKAAKKAVKTKSFEETLLNTNITFRNTSHP